MIVWGQLCVQRMWGGHVGVTICKKYSAKEAISNNSGQMPRGSSVSHVVLAVADFAKLFGGVRESCFLSKKMPNGIKDLKTVKCEDLKTKERLSPPKNMSLPLLREFR